MVAKVIILQGAPREHEGASASEADIKPGMLIEPVPSGDDVGKWQKHATAGGNSARIFAGDRLEMGNDIDTVYEINDRVKVLYFGQTQKVNALVGSGQNLVKGDMMESAGNGLLQKLTTGVPLGQCDETLGAVTVLSRCPVAII